MSLLRGFGKSDPTPQLQGEGVHLRLPQPMDYAAWAKLRQESRNFLTPWEPTWAHDDLTRFGYRRRLRRYAREAREDLGYSFFMFRKDDDALVGGISIGHIKRGVSQSASIGYWMGQRYARRGHMFEGVNMVVEHAFDDLGLHRIEAACLPTNDASKRLLIKAGFQWEGHARGLLKINGRWRDHLIFARLASED